MGHRTLVMLTLHGHGNGASDTRLDVDDEAFFIVADEYGQRVLVRGKNPKYFHPDDIRVHKKPVPLPRTE